MEENIITWLLANISLAVLSCFIAYQSSLIADIKTALGFNAVLPRFKWWFKPIGWLLKEFRDLFNCPYCISFHLSWLTNYFVFDFDLIQTFLYAGIIIVFVELYRKLTL